MVLLLLIGILAVVGLYLLYQKGTANEDYYVKRGLPFLKPSFLVGNSMPFFDSKTTLQDFIIMRYNAQPNVKALGLFDMRKPLLLLRDPALIKHFAVKHSENFLDHRSFVDEEMDVLFGNSLFLLRGQKWRDMRSTLSPAFTGSKMRLMFELIEEVCGQMMGHLRKEIDGKGLVDYEMKELCSRFTNDIIALCAFGIKVDSLKDRENEFYKAGQGASDFSKPSSIWKIMAFNTVPRLTKLLNIQLFGHLQGFFKNMVLGTMKIREEQKIVRPDMINLLMEIRKGTLEHKEEEKHESIGFATVAESEEGKQSHKRVWNDNEIVAQCFLFFVAGFDTSSTAMSFAIYQLALDPDVQQKLYEETSETQEELKSKGLSLNYESLQKMKYLDQVVSETLRMHPPAAMTDRQCVKDCVVDDGDGFRIECGKELGLWIPIFAIHRDPKYYPNPDKFDPERFSDENKHLINPDTYLPFGIGPRNCIGSRFALMQVKALIYHLSLNFSFHVTEKTQIPLKLKKSFGSVTTEKGIWIGFKSRN